MMLSKRWQGLFIMALAFTFSMGFASTAFAQDATTGLARVRAVDPDGAPLPGVHGGCQRAGWPADPVHRAQW